MDGCHDNQDRLHFMRLSPRQQRGRPRSTLDRRDQTWTTDQIKYGLRYVRCKVIGNSRSMEDDTKWTRALDEGFSRMRVDPKWNTSDLSG